MEKKNCIMEKSENILFQMIIYRILRRKVYSRIGNDVNNIILHIHIYMLSQKKIISTRDETFLRY